LTETLDQQRQIVLNAEASLRATNQTKPIKLATVLERFAMAHLKDAAPLVIDQVAMRSLGLSGGTVVNPGDFRLGSPFWEKFGLIYVPCPKGALLTSPRRMQALGIHSPAQTADLDDAFQEAILHGHDAS